MLIVVAIIGLLAAILLPVFNNARDASRRTVCNSHLRQIGIALELYSNDYNRRYPTDPPTDCKWTDALARYLKTSDILNCPSAPHEDYQPGCPPSREVDGVMSTFDGAYNLNGGEMGVGIAFSQFRIRNPSQMILVVDGVGTTMQFGKGSGPFSADDLIRSGIKSRHNGGANAAFADGHVKWLSPSALQPRSSWTLSGRDQS